MKVAAELESRTSGSTGNREKKTVKTRRHENQGMAKRPASSSNVLLTPRAD